MPLAEERFYKIKLQNGRILGPMDLNRIKLFILKDQFSGLENVRLYPDGDWKIISQYPEISELFLKKMEGKLEALTTVDPNTSPKPLSATATATPMLHEPPAVHDDEKTLVVTSHDEVTMVTPMPQEKEQASFAAPDKVEAQVVTELDFKPDHSVSQERTQVLDLKRSSGIANPTPPDQRPKEESLLKKRRKLLVIAGLIIAGLMVLIPGEQKKSEGPFKVEMPVPGKTDLEAAESLLNKALCVHARKGCGDEPNYTDDTVEGYKRASRLLLKALSANPNNVKALCFLASSYMNLFDVINRDENYFTVITRLIELARAKGVDLSETVIADVELYHILGNPDAALNRIVEFSKSHPYGVEQFYYLALTFFLKNDFQSALKYLGNIEAKDFFSPKIPYLYGLIFEKTGQLEEAMKAYQAALNRNSKHLKSMLRMAEIHYRRDNLPEVTRFIDQVLERPSGISKEDVARANYLRARVLVVARRDEEALESLQSAIRGDLENSDYWVEYYTIKARLGKNDKDAPGRAKMFQFLANGEKALKEKNLTEAMAAFLSAREAYDRDATPLLRIADVFRQKGDLQSAKLNYEKAVKIAPKNASIYPKYVHTLIDGYEFEEATRLLEVFKGLEPSVSVYAHLQGDLAFKQDRYRIALGWYKRALSASDVNPAVYVSYANVMLKSNNFSDAAFYYGLALRFDPLNVDAITGVGRSLSEIQGLQKGLEYMQGALERSPRKAAILTAMGEITVRKGDYNGAVSFADKATALDTNYALAYKVKGDAFAALEKTKEALDAYKTYTTFAPLDPTVHLERYKIFVKKLDLKSAKDEMMQIISGYPKFPGAYYMLGEIYNQGQNFDAALKAAQQEIQNNPSYLPAYVLVGTIYNSSNDPTKALGVLNKALSLDPNYIPALIQAGTANHKLKTYAAAQSMLERALKMDQGNPQIHKRLGALYFELGNIQKSKEHFQSYLNLFPDAPDRAEVERYTR